MKTQNNKLDFTKNSVTELNDAQQNSINGGGITSFSVNVSFDIKTDFDVNITFAFTFYV